MLLDYLQNALYIAEIIVGIGLLIFIHELGHFIMAKRNKVKVEAFSLGMGPVLWKRTVGGTEYRLSAIPIGGYVKMAGENIGDPRTGAPDEVSSKTAWQRLQIFAAGATMNLLIAFPLAILAFTLGMSVPVAEISVPGYPEARAGMRPGDVILEVDGMPIESLNQYSKEMVRRPEGKAVPVKVRHREGNEKTIGVKQSGSEQHRGTWPIMTTLADVRRGSPAWQAGLRGGDVVKAIDDQPIRDGYKLQETLKDSGGKKISLEVQRGDAILKTSPIDVPALRFTWPEDLGLMEAAVDGVAPSGPADVKGKDGKPFLKKGDIITKIDDSPIRSWQAMKGIIEASPNKPIKITRKRDGAEDTEEMTPTYNERDKGQLGIGPLQTDKVADVAEGSWYYGQGLRSGDKILAVTNEKGEWETGAVGVSSLFGSRKDQKPIGVRILRGSERIPDLYIAGKEEPKTDFETLGLAVNRKGDVALAANTKLRYWKFGDAVRDGLWEPIDITKLTFQIIGKLFSGQESAKDMAGPVGIFTASYHHAKMGLGNFVWLLVLITVNLGIFNLLPVPVLDGGHVLLLAIEKVRGRPPSPRFVEVFQMVGLVLLLLLVVFVTYNDITR